MLNVQIDLSGIDRLIEKRSKAAKNLAPIISRALNRAGDQATTALGRELGQDTGLAVRKVRESVRAKRSSQYDLVYRIVVKGGAIPLSEFGPRETRRGVSARPWGQRRVFPGTFQGVAGERVFKRTGPERLPIKQLYGPDLAKEVERGQSLAVVKDVAGESFARRLEHEIARTLMRRLG